MATSGGLLSRWAALAVLAVFIIPTTGCTLGSRALSISRSRYNEVVQRTAKEQMLLNLVRLKYREPPEFMAIPSVTEQYSFAGSLGLSAGNLLDFGSSGIATDFGVSTSETPTISYIPLQDDEFNTRLLTPVSLDTVSLMTRTGWNFHRVLKLTVKNINNVDNATTAGGPTPQKKPEFEQFDQLCRLLRTLQERNEIEIIYASVDEAKQISGPIAVERVSGADLISAAEKGYEFRPAQDGKSMVLWSGAGRSMVLQVAADAVDSEEMQTVIRMLNLPPGQTRYKFQQALQGRLHLLDKKHSDLVIDTCSFLEILYYLAHAISVPDEHIEQGLVTVTRDEKGRVFDWIDLTGELIRIRTSEDRPDRTAVAIKYRDHWFYIDDADLNSKSTFNLLLELYNLEIRGSGGSQGPLLTIGTGG